MARTGDYGTGHDFNYLAKRMPQFADALGKDVNQLVKDVTAHTVAAVARATPVDVGTARSNWIVSLVAPSSTVRAAFSPFPSRWRPPYGPGGPMGETRNQAGVVWSGAAVIGRRTDDATVYITNNLPYIVPLNRGHSSLAPAGFVETAILRGRREALKQFKFNNLRRL